MIKEVTSIVSDLPRLVAYCHKRINYNNFQKFLLFIAVKGGHYYKEHKINFLRKHAGLYFIHNNKFLHNLKLEIDKFNGQLINIMRNLQTIILLHNSDS
jgi:hypothetical protein